MTMLKRYLMISLLVFSSVQAAEEKKVEENLAKEVAEMATSEDAKPDREKDISQLIEKNLRGGEAIWLGNEDTFLALYKENTWKDTQGAILLLHDLGANADWPQLMNPLRLAFPQKGWHTLSLQLPMVTPDEDKKSYLSLFDESVSRVKSGMEFLKQKNISNIVLVGHGIGAAIGLFFVNQNPQAPVTALVAISLPGENALKPQKEQETGKAVVDISEPDPASEEKNKQDEKGQTEDPAQKASPSDDKQEQPERNLYAEMKKIKIPFLDVYAQVDHQDVVREALKRSELMSKTDNQKYSQWQIKGADHYFRGVEPQLMKRLRGWLKNYASGMEIPLPSS